MLVQGFPVLFAIFMGKEGRLEVGSTKMLYHCLVFYCTKARDLDFTQNQSETSIFVSYNRVSSLVIASRHSSVSDTPKQTSFACYSYRRFRRKQRSRIEKYAR